MVKHNYTNELELKSIMIRIQVARKINRTSGSNKTIAVDDKKNVSENRKISKYIKWASSVQKKNIKNAERVRAFQTRVRELVIRKSEKTPIDSLNYEKFGYIIMEMVRHILTKPQFRGYTYYDDFMSDSVFKILKYLDNFDHKIISKRSGEPVKAFAYISQIIQNSIIYIISKRKKEQDFIRQQMSIQLNNDDLLESWEVCKPETNEKRIFVDGQNIVKKLCDIAESEKEFLKEKTNVLTVICTEGDSLDIDELSSIESMKKVYKNFRFTTEEK